MRATRPIHRTLLNLFAVIIPSIYSLKYIFSSVWSSKGRIWSAFEDTCYHEIVSQTTGCGKIKAAADKKNVTDN
jgi:hypothetical protein